MKKFTLLLIVACLLMFCSSCGNTADVKEIEQIKQDIADIKQQIGSISPGDEFDYTSKTEEKQADETVQDAEYPSECIYTAGYYTVGTDIPEGKYDVKWISGDRWLEVLDLDEHQVMHESMGPIEDNNYNIKEFKNLTLSTGYTLRITGNLKVAFVAK